MLFGFVSYGYWGPLAAFVAEQFPTRLRGVGNFFLLHDRPDVRRAGAP